MRRLEGLALLLPLLLAACGDAAAPGAGQASPSASAPALVVSVQNSELLVGVDRLSVALFDTNRRPVVGASASFEVSSAGKTLETGPLQSVGAEYAHSVGAEFGGIPVYDGVARLPAADVVLLTVHATLRSGIVLTGQQSMAVTTQSRELPVGYKVPALRQPILGDPGVTIAQIDSGVPPDDWHTTTIADGLAQHKPMILYFGEPGLCKSQTCGPTVVVLQKLCATYCGRFVFEHVEDHFPAGPDETSKDNPVFAAFGLQTDPWIFFVNANGVVSDRFEGPVTVAELATAADGTLAGHVPAVDIAATGS